MAKKKKYPAPAKRTGSRDNKDGTKSTHLYSWGESDGKFVAFPTLFQNDNGEFYESEDPFQEAMKKGEIIPFDNKRKAKKFAEGGWKKEYDEQGNPKFAFGGIFGNSNPDPMQDYLGQQYERLIANPTFIENPNATLADNSIRQARAMQEAQSNPWTQGLDVLGSLALQYGTSMMGSGMSSNTPSGEEAGNNWVNRLGGYDAFANTTFVPGNTAAKLAFGGKTGLPTVEVEGNEVAQTPNGNLIDFVGPSHENGGIDVALPGGTEIFSDRIKIDGKTMAERKKAREKQNSKLEKLSTDNLSDFLLKNTIARTKTTSEAENNFDMKLQESIANEENKFAYGGTSPVDMLMQYAGLYGPNISQPFNYKFNNDGTVLDEIVIDAPGNQGTTDTTQSTAIPGTTNTGYSFNQAGMPTFGDALGIYGNLNQAFAPMQTTLQNRAGDTPNINFFRDYGKDGLETLQGGKDYITGVRDQNIQDLNINRAGAVGRNRNSARGINTQRALDLATDSQTNQALNDLYGNFASQMLGIIGQESQMENQQDQMVMQGEQARDLADRQDRDAFFSNLVRDRLAIGEGLSRTGRSINDIKERGTNQNFLNTLSDYVNVNVMNGTMSAKQGLNLIGNGERGFKNFEKNKGYEGSFTKAEWDKLTEEQKKQFYIKNLKN